jgi:hypothetical protein
MSEKTTCDNCGSNFTLLFEEDEVSYSPSHCPFCGDFYDSASEELDFGSEDDSLFEDFENDNLFEKDN